ncbi:hypothetical protein ACFL6T_00425 [Candidatus Zixiibacteriota bacterium]
MAENGGFIEITERLDRQRNQSLAWFMWSFLIWSFLQIFVITGYAFMNLLGSPLLPWVFLGGGLVPLALWICFLLRYFFLGRRIRSNPAIAEALRDEMVKEAWHRAAAAGFWSMLAVEASFTILKVISTIVVSHFLGAPHLLILLEIRSPLAIAVGLGVTIGTYLRYRRD